MRTLPKGDEKRGSEPRVDAFDVHGQIVAIQKSTDWTDVMRSATGEQLVSVIVPCFNTAAYLDESLTSLVDQSYGNLEIIAIDDGSTDDTPGVLDEWRRRDDRVCVVHQINRGLGAARNVGLDRAMGRYLTFVDSDDLLPPDALARMVTSIERTSSDFVTGVVQRFDDEHTWRSSLYRYDFDQDVDRTHVYERPSLLADHIICSKLFRRSFWDENGLRFPEGTFFEDIELATRAHCLARSVDVLSEPTYLWRSRPPNDASITQDRTRPGSVTHRFEALARADQYLREHAPSDIWLRHGVKVLSMDIPLYLGLVRDGDEEFVEEFVRASGTFLDTACPAAIRAQGYVRRRLVQMLRAGDVRSVRAMSQLTAARATRSPRSLVAAFRMLGWRDRAWLIRATARTAWSRVLRRATSMVNGRSSS